MISEHGEPCGVLDAFYCLNGGSCFKIPSVSTPTCVCPAGFKGSRCDQFQLSRSSQVSENGGLIAAVIIVTLLILVVLVVVIYYSCKMWRQKFQGQEERRPYWILKTPVHAVIKGGGAV